MLLYIIVIILFFSACTSNQQSNQTIENTVTAMDTTQIKTTTALKPKLNLTVKAQEALSNWRLYQALTKKLDSIKSPTLVDLKRITPQMVVLFQNKEEAENAQYTSTPASLNAPAVQARLLALETQVKVLRDLSTKNKPDTTKISVALTALFNAHQDLNLQVNERFSKSVEEILKDFEEQLKDDKNDSFQDIATPSGKPPIKLYKKEN